MSDGRFDDELTVDGSVGDELINSKPDNYWIAAFIMKIY